MTPIIYLLGDNISYLLLLVIYSFKMPEITYVIAHDNPNIRAG